MPLSLEVEGLTVSRDGRAALAGVSLRIEEGERVFLLGPNGAGKTTLLHALVGAVPFEGKVRIGGTEVGPRTLAEVRRRVGFVFADPGDQLFTDEVYREVAFGPEARGLDATPPLQAKFDAYREVYRKYRPADARYLQNHRGHLMFLRPEEQEFITGDVIRGMTFSATAPELIEQLREIKRAGYRHFAFHARHRHEVAMLEDWAEVVAKV